MIMDYFENKRREREREARREALGNAAAGMAVGLVVGAALGIIFAPKSGAETRAAIGTASKDAYGTVKTSVKNFVDEAGEKIKNICDCSCDIGDLSDVFDDIEDEDEASEEA